MKMLLMKLQKKNTEKKGFYDYYSVWIIYRTHMKFYLNKKKEMKIKIILI